MPLIGLSASVIPYIMAMIFTMLVFNADNQAANRNSSLNETASIHISDINVTPLDILTGNYINFFTAADVTGVQKKEYSPEIRQALLCPCSPEDLILQSIPLSVRSRRGPPSA